MRAKRSLGQNFLVDPNIQRRIVDAVDPRPEDTVIEIGPGEGALTDHLVRSAGRLLAIELDDRLAPLLADRYVGLEHVQVIHGDALEWEPRELLASASVKVVGNIPYNITSPLLFRFLEWQPPPERIVVMIQKEVADRILAPPGEKAYGSLSVGIRAVAEVKRLFNVGRGAFRPSPDVDSSVILIRPGRPLEPPLARALRSLTRATFGLRRKQLQKILRTATGYGLTSEEAVALCTEVGVRPQDRPETLDPGTFIALAAALLRRGYPNPE